MSKVLKYFFILSGAKFYMDYLLITNPASKNIFIQFFYRKAKNEYTAYNYKARYNLAINLGIIHFLWMLLLFAIDTYFIVNLLINIYPLIVQIWVGYRCWIIKKTKILYE